jgi:alkylation response protein AidB-like acyl-CoA dehydrogenase
MGIAVSEDHRSLAEVAAELSAKRDLRGAGRALLEAPAEQLPDAWKEIVDIGWPGLHLPEEHGGSGYGLEELVVVVEELGRSVAPGPFVPSVIASAVIASAGDDAAKADLLPRFASGELVAGIAVDAEVTVAGDRASGTAGAVLGGALAGVVVVPVGDDVAVIPVGDGVGVQTPPNVDPTRRTAKMRFDRAGATVLRGGRRLLIDIARTVLAAEAVGVASECTRASSAYAKERVQFGRPIGTYQAVKHHCANMYVASETATAAVWDAARAAKNGGEAFTFAAAAAATLAATAAYDCANLNVQVHGGIGYTWEHDAHLLLRRALVLQALLDPDASAQELTALTRRGVVREKAIQLPPEAESIRAEVRQFLASLDGLDEAARRRKLIDSGYLMAHWPKPWGRNAGPVEQLVIEEEFGVAGIQRGIDPITSYVTLTMVQQASEDQVKRWVPGALGREFTWCQLFSEPDAGSDAAGVKTRATRTDGGWLVNGQKVWTSGAREAGLGLCTVRTNTEVAKHKGITMMVVDMRSPGVEVRPLRQLSGEAHFNEVFLNDVFVPDENVVGEIDGGWTVARATLGNESISVGSDDSAASIPGAALIAAHDAHPARLPGGDARIGRYTARYQALALLNLRRVSRAVEGGGPSPEGAITKLVMAELFHEAAAVLAAAVGPDIVYRDGDGEFAATTNLTHRVWSIGGGTSEIKRNQIGERLLGLPRDPLLG